MVTTTSFTYFIMTVTNNVVRSNCDGEATLLLDYLANISEAPLCYLVFTVFFSTHYVIYYTMFRLLE